MARKLVDICADLDVMLEKRAQEKQASAPAASGDDDEIEKLAKDFVDFDPEPVGETIELNEAEKIAHSMAVVETLLCGKDIKKACAFEKEALSRGVDKKEVEETLTKFASKTKAGDKVYEFMKGLGSGLGDMTNTIARKSPSASKSESAGRVAGLATPFLAAGGAGVYGGSKLKESEMKRKLGIR